MKILGVSLLTLLLIFVAKVIDNILSTAKQIYVQKNKTLLACITLVLENIIYYVIITKVVDGNNAVIGAIALAGGVGTWLAMIICGHFSKDRLFVNVVLSDDKVAIKKLSNYLNENDISTLTTDGYTKEWKKTLAIIAYCETKKESKILDTYLAKYPNKFKRIVQIGE